MLWRRSVTWRLGLLLVILQIVIATMAGWLGGRQLIQVSEQRAGAEVERNLIRVIERCEPYLATAAPDELGRMMRDEADRSGLRTTIVRDDRVLADSHVEAVALENEFTRPEIIGALRNGLAHDFRDSGILVGPAVYVAARVDTKSGTPFIFRAGGLAPSPRATVLPLVRTVLVIAMLGMSLTLLFTWILSRHLERAADGIRQGTARFAAGDLQYRIESHDAELAGVVRGLNDMAERLGQREDRIQLHERELQAILQSITSGVIAIDPEQRIVDLNRAAGQLLGVDAVGARGRLLQEVVRQPELHGFIGAALTQPMPPTVEFVLSGAQPLTVEATSEVLRADDGETRGLLVLLNDVTHVRRLESLRSDFAANVSHELRTPITNIKGYVETLLETELADNSQAERFLAVVKQNSDRLAAIVEDVMALTKLEQPQAPDTLTREETPLMGQIRSVIQQFDDRASEKRIALTSDAPPDLTVVVHGPLLEQAIGNLVSNAINYSPPDTHVKVSARPRDSGEVEIAVTDQGPGIAAEHVPRLFERFYRVDKGRSRAVGGTGLGLAIVKHIALVHGGNVEVDTVVGRGSTFRIVLPA